MPTTAAPQDAAHVPSARASERPRKPPAHRVTASTRAVENVVKPALAAPRGLPRLQSLFDRWLTWSQSDPSSGGCFFVAMATELDDRPGPARDLLVRLQRSWIDLLAGVVDVAIREGQLRPDSDPEQLAHDAYGAMLAYHHASRLLDDPAAEERARRSFASLLDARRTPAS